MVSEGALEQWHLLEAASAGLGGRTVMHHHVLGKSPLHTGQHFDEVLLQHKNRPLMHNGLLLIIEWGVIQGVPITTVFF